MQKVRVLGLALFLGSLLLPSAAWAQYRNASFGVDTAFVLFPVRPSIYDSNGNYLKTSSSHPNRLGYGLRLGGEYNFKLHHDHWWFDARIDLTLYQWGSSSSSDPFLQSYDATAAASVGSVLGLDGMIGIRYYFLTDYFKPFLEVGLSVEHLFSFGNDSSNTCDPTGADGGLCPDGDTYGNEFLPHTTFLGLHIMPGMQFVVDEDIAIHFMLDFQRWVIFNADDNTLLTFVLGVSFF